MSDNNRNQIDPTTNINGSCQTLTILRQEYKSASMRMSPLRYMMSPALDRRVMKAHARKPRGQADNAHHLHPRHGLVAKQPGISLRIFDRTLDADLVASFILETVSNPCCKREKNFPLRRAHPSIIKTFDPIRRQSVGIVTVATRISAGPGTALLVRTPFTRLSCRTHRCICEPNAMARPTHLGYASRRAADRRLEPTARQRRSCRDQTIEGTED